METVVGRDIQMVVAIGREEATIVVSVGLLSLAVRVEGDDSDGSVYNGR